MPATFSKILPPVPVDAQTIRDIKAKARKTGLSQADVVRQSLRIGLPQIEFAVPLQKRRPKCFAWIHKVPPIDVSVHDVKKLIKARIAKKNGLHC